MTMAISETMVISGRCMSAGSICIESGVVSIQASLLEQNYVGEEASVIALPDLVFQSVKDRHVPAAPFDNPSTVPLHSHMFEPVQSRKTIFVHDLGDSRISLVASIPVALDFWRDSVTACCYDLEDFGVGEDEFSALADLKASLVELYYLLRAEAENLGPLSRQHWDYLRTIIREN